VVDYIIEIEERGSSEPPLPLQNDCKVRSQ